MYGWVDSAYDNWPPLIAREFAPILWKLVEDIDEKLAYNMFSEALNKRLGVDGKNISDLAMLAAEKNMSLSEVMAMPELDGWIYSGVSTRDGPSYVCSAYVTALYKAAGVFGDLDVNATEFTPMDVPNLKFWDETSPRPDACVVADPDLPYCQLRGKFRVVHPYYNTIDPYERMFE